MKVLIQKANKTIFLIVLLIKLFVLMVDLLTGCKPEISGKLGISKLWGRGFGVLL